MNPNDLKQIIDFLIGGFIGLLVGSLKYLSKHSSKFSIKEYISVVAGSLLGGYIVFYVAQAFKYNNDWRIALAFVGAGAGTKVMDVIVNKIITYIENK